MPSLFDERNSDDRRARRRVRRCWRKQLQAIVTALESKPAYHVIEPDDLKRFNIHISRLYLEEDENVLDFEPRFFTPLPPNQLPFSPCLPAIRENDHRSTVPVPDCPSYVFYHGQELAHIMNGHLRSTVLFSEPLQRTLPGFQWRQNTAEICPGARYRGWIDPRERKWLVYRIYDLANKMPHLILLFTSDDFMEEKLLRSELLVITSFMAARMGSKTRKRNLIYPILMVSIHKPIQARIIQAHFDGALHVRCSKFYNFAVEDHEDVMSLFIRWLMSTPHGDTTLATLKPILPDQLEPNDSEQGGRENMIPVTSVKACA